MIGIFGYAGLAPVVFLLLAIILGRTESGSEDALRSLGPQSSTNNGRERPQEVFKEDLFKEKHTV
jgi:hypothetical protein